MKTIFLLFTALCLVGVLSTNAQEITDSITNPSFETGDNTGWTIIGAEGYKWVGPNTDGDSTKNGAYITGVWNKPIGDVEWAQTINLPNGIYKVTGDFTVNNGGKGNRLTTQRLFAGNKSMLYASESDYPVANIDSLQETEIVSFGNYELSESENGPFKTLHVVVEVTDGELTLGARTNGQASITDFDFSYASGDAGFFKFDNIKLYNVGKVTLDSLTLSVGFLNAEFDPAVLKYTAILPMGTKTVTPLTYVMDSSITVEGAEAVDVSGKSGTSSIVVTTLDGTVVTYTIDYTVLALLEEIKDSIVNPSFETGDNTGWTITEADGYKWLGPNTDGDNTKDGAYITGVWNNPIGDVEWAQTIDLPNGIYKITGDFTVNNGRKGNRLTTQRLFAGNKSVLYASESDYPVSNILTLEETEIVSFGNHELSERENGPFKTLSVVVEVTDGELTLGARTSGQSSVTDFDFSYASGDAGFIKFDNFRLYDYGKATLDSLTLSVGSLDTAFDPEIFTYTATLPFGTTTVTPKVIVSYTGITATGDGTVDVSENSGTSLIEVTTLDGSKYIYTINYVATTLPGTVAWWKFDEGSGSITKDEAGLSPGTLGNFDDSLRVEGVLGGALNFNGGADSSYLEIPGNNVIDFDSTTSFTISVLVKVEDISGTDMNIVFKGATTNNGADEKGHWYGITFKNDELRFIVDDDVNKSQLGLPNANSIMNMSGWNHIVGVRDIAKDTMYIYLNGELVASMLDVTENNITSNPLPLLVGNNPDHNRRFPGLIDELQMYNTALSASQIRILSESYGLAKELSGDNKLSNLMVDGITVDGFSPEETTYNIELPYGTTIVPPVTATTNDSYASFIVTNAVELPGTTTILVKAEDGSILEYTISFTVSTVSNIADLLSITLDPSVDLSPAFDKEVTSYTATLPAGTQKVRITVTTSEEAATVFGDGTVNVSSGSGIAAIMVTAPDGKTTKTYMINFSVMVGINTINEAEIGAYIDGMNNELVLKGADNIRSFEIYDITGKKVVDVNQNITDRMNLDKYVLKSHSVYLVKLVAKQTDKCTIVKTIN